MTQKQSIQLFEERNVRTIWDDVQEKWYFSVVDVIQVLTANDYQTARKYWNKLKERILQEAGQPVTICHQFKLRAADGKMRLSDVADQEQLFRIIQSVPSPKAEPFKQWMAKVASDRLDQLQDPELSIQQAIADYARLGYSDKWINQRIRSIEVRKELTDEWKRGGMQEDRDYAALTDIISKAWSGMTTREYKRHKGLRKENLRDNMTNVELMLNGLAEAAATELSQRENPQGFRENAEIAQRGGNVAHVAREQLEHELGGTVISSKHALHFTTPPDELPLATEEE